MTAGRVPSDSEYGRAVYANELEKVSSYTTSCEKNYFPCTKYLDEVSFLILWNYNKDTQKPFCD